MSKVFLRSDGVHVNGSITMTMEEGKRGVATIRSIPEIGGLLVEFDELSLASSIWVPYTQCKNGVVRVDGRTTFGGKPKQHECGKCGLSAGSGPGLSARARSKCQREDCEFKKAKEGDDAQAED